MATRKSGAPSATVGDADASVGRLTAVGGELLGRRYVVETAVVLGRGSGCEIELPDTESSRSHAKVSRRADGQFEVEDLGSRNGTFVNGVEVERSTLSFGDRLRIGRSIFTFSRHDEVSETLFKQNRVDSVGHITLGLAHDLNNALCVIQGMTALVVEERSLSDADRAEYLNDALAACDRAALLTKRMMGFARGHEEKASVVDLSEVVKEGARLVVRSLPHGIRLDVDVPDGLRVFAESSQVMQVLLNLVINARDAIVAADRPGLVRVSGRAEEGEVVLVVADDGCGMTPEVKQRIFEPFFTTKGVKGHGIGLSSVFEIVHTHGGRIDVESLPGRGTTFTVRLRREGDAAKLTSRKTLHDPGSPLGKGERVLVVDEDAGARTAIEKTLFHAGYRVALAKDFDSVADDAGPFDLLIVDLDHDARRIERGVAGLRRVGQVPGVVCLTTSADETTTVRARALDASAALTKPFLRSELLIAVRHALTRAVDADPDQTSQIRRSPR